MTELNEPSPGPEIQFQVERLLARYALALDEGDLESWPELFCEDCTYQLISRENADRGMPIAAIFCDSKAMLIDRVVSLRHANIYEKHNYRHIISSTHIDDVAQGVIRTRSNYVVYRTRTAGLTEVYNAGIYHDEIINTAGVYRFRAKRAIFDTNMIDSLLATPI